MKSTCKDNIWIGGSVYNLNNVTLDVDPKCIFVVQIYYRVFFFNESSKLRKSCFFRSLFGAWDGAGGAVTSCLKLHEVSPNNVLIKLRSVSAVRLFFFPSDSKCRRYILTAHSSLDFLFKALKAPFPPPSSHSLCCLT